MRDINVTLFAATCLLGVAPAVSRAQLVTESVDLEPGWNAVWLNIEPEPNEVATLLANLPPPLDCQAVWLFDPTPIGSTSTIANAPGRWFVYDKSLPAELQSLHAIHGHLAYFIKVNVAGQLLISGHPVSRNTSFSSHTSNLFGVLTKPTVGSLTFEEYFSLPGVIGKIRTGAQPNQHDLFALEDGALVRRSLLDLVAPNRAYWVNVVQNFDFGGLVDVTTAGKGLSFGRTTALTTLNIGLPSLPTSRTLSLHASSCVSLGSEACPAGSSGEAWLEYRDDSGGGLPVWRSLADGVDVIVPPKTAKVELTLRARRALVSDRGRSAMGAVPINPLPPVVIDVTDDQGSRALVSADVIVEPIFGQWVGQAHLTKVSTHPVLQSLPLDQAEAIPMDMTLILELPGPDDQAGGAVPHLLDSIALETFRDGRALQRRFTSALIDRPLVLVEDEGDPVDPLGATGTLHGTLHIAPHDPLNPYRHRYNPEHRLGYDITRDITIEIRSLGASVADELAGLDGTFGPHRLAGRYTEVITGITADPITVQGEFRLDRFEGQPVSN
ncbi:MAG: hypothetical protein J5J06_00290 [Phycisphaerae bacterium]|nr:hypothetical protein [Phycisphaerae bacterium]